MRKRVLIIFLFGVHFLLNGQTNDMPKSFKSLPFENINLHTDRDLYLSGETIWFSAEVSLENNLEPLSQIIYIELFNADQKSIISKKYRIKEGYAEGAIDIPSEFLSDVYFLRAYTHYNKNFPADYFFMSAIQVINPRIGLPKKTAQKKIKNSRSNNPHTIEVNEPINNQILISIYKSKTSGKNGELITLEVLNNQLQLISLVEFPVSNNPTKIAIPNSIFSYSGLHYYMLRNKNDSIIKIQAFIFQDISSHISNITIKEKKYNQRGLVTINIEDIQEVNIGIKVVLKGTTLPVVEKLDLYFDNPTLLISYLKNQFNPSDLTPNELNTFIKTLNRKLNTKAFTKLFYPPEATKLIWNPEIRDIGLSGITVEKQTQKPIANIPIYLSIFKDHPQIHIATTLENGSFQFSLNNLENNQDVFLCPLLDTLDNLEIKINRDFSLDFPKLNPIPLTIDSSNTRLIKDMFIASQISKAFTSNKSQVNFNKYLPYSFDHPETSIMLDDYIETPTMEMVLKELVPNVRVRKKNNKYMLTVFDTEQELYYNDPLILVDDIPIFNLDELMKISPKLIEKIEVHKTPFILGDHTINGIIMISTFTDNFGGMVMPESSTFFEYQTVSPAYTFKAKNYATSKELKSRSADFRTVLHWNPFIQKNSSNELQFFTSDQTGVYETYIFGTYANGQAFQSKLFDLEVIN